MSVNLAPTIVDGPIPSGPQGEFGLFPLGDWTAGEKRANALVRRYNCIFRAKVTTTQAPAFGVDGSVSSTDWDLFLDGRPIVTAAEEAAAALVDAFFAAFLGTFSSDPAIVGDPPLDGTMYFNRLSHKLKIWYSSGWHNYDEAAQAAAATASDAAGTATAAAGTATGAASTATGAATTASNAAATATTKASDAAASAAGALGSYNNANALLSSVSSYAIIAQQAAASAVAVSNLSILAAAQRAIKISSALVAGAAVPYDTTKDEVSDWPRKCVSQSYLSDTLNTATRGTVAAVPAQMVVMGETTVLSVFMGTDGLGALWKSWTVAGLTCVFARSGSIWYGGTGGLYRLDLITDEVYKRDTSGLWLCINQKVADYNQGTATWSLVSSAGAIASATVNSVSAYTADMTQSVKARFGLPNPTVAVGTNAGLSVIRWDGFVSNSTSTLAYLSVAFDSYGNLWSLYNGGALYACSPATYQAASFNITALASFSLAQLLISSPSKITACGPGMIAIAGSNGLATLKLDPTNPANSLYRVKTTTYDTGWMVLGKTVLAMAESSADLATLTGAQVVANSTFATDLSGWTSSDAGTGYASAWNTGGGMILPCDATAANYGRRTQQITVPANSGGIINLTTTGGEVRCYIGTVANAGDIANIVTTGGAAKASFVAPASGVVWVTILAVANNTSPVVTLITCDVAAADRSGSSNGPKAVGSPTRGQMASGTDSAGYGMTAANFFRLSHVAALDLGANDFAVMCPFTWPTSGDYSTICHYTDEIGTYYGNGAYWFLRVNYDGVVSAVFYDGSQTRAITSSAVVPTTGVHSVGLARRGQFAELYLDGVRIARASLSTLASLSNASANLLIGVTYLNNAIVYPFPGKLGKLRLFNCAPTQDQFAFMMADEAGSNVANAKELLSGANVQAVAFDPDTGQLAASNSTGGTDVFAGPGFSVRVANWKSTTATNKIRNSQLTGAVVGTPGTMPTDCVAGSVPSGVAVNVVGKGYVNGNGYVDLQIVGTPAATQSMYLYPGGIPIAGAPAASGQSWTAALQMALVGGALTNIGTTRLVLTGVTSGGSTAESQTATFALNGTLQNVPASKTMAQATTATACLTVDLPLTSGQAVNATIRISQPYIAQVASFTAFSDGLSANDNHKSVAFMGGDLVVATGAGVDAFLAVKPGLRETAGGVGAPRRPFYDPTFGIFSLVTTDATPTVAVSTPIPEGKAYRIRDTVSFVQVGGVATEKAAYVAEALVTRDLGGNVVVSATTTTISETTASMDYVIQANTTAQTCEGKPTGKASTCGMWVIEREVYDAGLQTAA